MTGSGGRLPVLARLEALELGINDEHHLPLQVVTRIASQIHLSVSISFRGALSHALEVFFTPGVLNFNAQLLQLSSPSHSLESFKTFDPWS
jgi:hypothetical protein